MFIWEMLQGSYNIILINISEKECKITTSQEGLSSEYTGAGENMQNLGLQFDGLWKSISRVYSLLKRE
jgi:hypothetical protein